MHIIYDYIAMATIFVLIFTFSTASLLNVVELPVRHITEQQLFTRADSVLGSLLGYLGEPKNWGENITLRPEELKAVGLSRTTKTDVIYDLDPDKLSRLIPIDTGASIDKSTLYRLLNLGNDYRFFLRLTPVLNISITPLGYVPSPPAPKEGLYTSKFLVTVTTHELTPVGNVNLTVYVLTAYYDVSNKLIYYVTNETKSATTMWNGSATFDYTTFMTELLEKEGPSSTKLVGSLLVIIGNFYGMQTVYVYKCSYTGEPTIEGIVLGKYLIFEDSGPGPIFIPIGGKSKKLGADKWDSSECTFGGVVVTAVENSTIYGKAPWLTIHDGKRFQVLELTYLEPDIYYIVLVAKYQGDYFLVVFPRIPVNFQVGDVVPRGTQVVGIRRIVFVEKMAFFADFYFWRTFS
jgi:hypothetical protein